MKIAVFAALALVATTASAQDIQITSVLRMNGKVVEEFKGAKPNGQAQTFSSLKRIPYKESVTQIEGGKAQTNTGYFDTGFYMEILPTLTSDGSIRYVLSASNDNLKAVPNKVGDVEIESPTGSKDKFVQSVIAKQGEETVLSFGTHPDEPAKNYVLAITATALND